MVNIFQNFSNYIRSLNIIHIEMTQNTGPRKIILEVELKIVVQAIQECRFDLGWHRGPLMGIRNIMNRDWIVIMKYIFREENSCANWLAKEAINQSLGTYSLAVCLVGLIFTDIVMVSIPHLCFFVSFFNAWALLSPIDYREK